MRRTGRVCRPQCPRRELTSPKRPIRENRISEIRHQVAEACGHTEASPKPAGKPEIKETAKIAERNTGSNRSYSCKRDNLRNCNEAVLVSHGRLHRCRYAPQAWICETGERVRTWVRGS
ncbi:uncharacterized protein LOC144099020 isoform X2 [Amblyomma americanum]